MLKQVIVIRKDLKLGKGKIAAQSAHAAILASDKSKFKKEWKKEGQKKVVVFCQNLQELLSLCEAAENHELPTAIVKDAGLTQIEKGTITCIGIGPDMEDKINQVTGKLKLL